MRAGSISCPSKSVPGSSRRGCSRRCSRCVLIAVLLSLGRWQLRRADEKRVLFDSFAAGTERHADRSIGDTPPLPRYQHVEAGGHYDAGASDPDRQHGERRARRLFRDHAVRAAGRRLGAGESRLGALGRQPRRAAADSGRPANSRSVRGRADHLPSPGIQMGDQGALAPPFRRRELSERAREIAQLLQESSWTARDGLMLLDPGEPDGYVRDWSPPGFPPMRHIGYAVQWFALALALPVIYVVTNLRARRRSVPARHDEAGARATAASGACLIGLALLFFAPLASRFYLYYGQAPGIRAAASMQGDLIEPARPLPALVLPLLGVRRTPIRISSRAKWTLLYVQPGAAPRLAADVCTTRGRCGWRWIATWTACSGCSSPTAAAATAEFLRDAASGLDRGSRERCRCAPAGICCPAATECGAAMAQRVYLIDPLGNLMMFYAAGREAEGHARGHEAPAAAVFDRLAHERAAAAVLVPAAWRWPAPCSPRRSWCSAPGCGSPMPVWAVPDWPGCYGHIYPHAGHDPQSGFSSPRHCTK